MTNFTKPAFVATTLTHAVAAVALVFSLLHIHWSHFTAASAIIPAISVVVAAVASYVYHDRAARVAIQETISWSEREIAKLHLGVVTSDLSAVVSKVSPFIPHTEARRIGEALNVIKAAQSDLVEVSSSTTAASGLSFQTATPATLTVTPVVGTAVSASTDSSLGLLDSTPAPAQTLTAEEQATLNTLLAKSGATVA